MRKVIKYIVVTVTILSVLMSMMVIPAAAAESDEAVIPAGSYTWDEDLLLFGDSLVYNEDSMLIPFDFVSNGIDYFAMGLKGEYVIVSDVVYYELEIFYYRDIDTYDIAYQGYEPGHPDFGEGGWNANYRHFTLSRDSVVPVEFRNFLIIFSDFNDLSVTTYEGSYYYIYDYDEFWLDDTPDFSADVPGGFTCGADSSIVYNKISVSTPASGSSQSRLITFTRVDGTVDLVYSPEDLWYAEYYKQINFLAPLTISSSSALSDFLTFNYTDVRPSYAPYFLDGEYRLSALPDWRSLLGIYSISGGVYYVSSIPSGPDIPEYLDLPFKAYGSDYVSMHGSAPGVQVYKDNRWIEDDYRYISFDNAVVSSSVYSWFHDINNAVLMDSEYQAGYNDGYNSGYEYGYNAGSSSSIGNNFFGDLFAGVGEGLSHVVLLEYPIGDTMVKVTIWSVFGTIVVIMIVVWVLKLIAGG